MDLELIQRVGITAARRGASGVPKLASSTAVIGFLFGFSAILHSEMALLHIHNKDNYIFHQFPQN